MVFLDMDGYTFNMHSHIYRRDFVSLNAKSFLCIGECIGEWHHLNSVGAVIDSHYIGEVLRCYTQNLYIGTFLRITTQNHS